jgi:hypothetical protein
MRSPLFSAYQAETATAGSSPGAVGLGIVGRAGRAFIVQADYRQGPGFLQELAGAGRSCRVQRGCDLLIFQKQNQKIAASGSSYGDSSFIGHLQIA